ncbi:MAG: hypothetical protein EBR82_29280 [Caulobacteraceae bacterium]|nr:hypothetical protein [Caulobacteraceae bacterium]
MTEFFKVILESLRKQPFQVMLLLAACFVLYSMMQDVKQEALNTKAALEGKIAQVNNEVKECITQKEILSVELATLRERVNTYLSSAPKRRN